MYVHTYSLLISVRCISAILGIYAVPYTPHTHTHTHVPPPPHTHPTHTEAACVCVKEVNVYVRAYAKSILQASLRTVHTLTVVRVYICRSFHLLVAMYVQVVNHLNVELDLYMTRETSTLKPLAVLQPGEAFPFPLAAILHEESFSVVPHGFGFVLFV